MPLRVLKHRRNRSLGQKSRALRPAATLHQLPDVKTLLTRVTPPRRPASQVPVDDDDRGRPATWRSRTDPDGHSTTPPNGSMSAISFTEAEGNLTASLGKPPGEPHSAKGAYNRAWTTPCRNWRSE